jgi:VanZ family protein
MRPSLSTPASRRWLAILWTAGIFVACWLPRRWMPVREGSPQAHPALHADKIVHVALFAGFGFLWLRALPRGSGSRVVLLGLLLAIVTELGQNHHWVGRDGSVDDGLADLIGAFIGVWTASTWAKLFPAAPIASRLVK